MRWATETVQHNGNKYQLSNALANFNHIKTDSNTFFNGRHENVDFVIEMLYVNYVIEFGK